MEESNRLKNQKKLPTQSYFPVILLFISGITISLLMFLLIYRWEQTNHRLEFESWAKTYANAVQSTLNEYVGALLFLENYFDNSPLPVTRQKFNNVVKRLISRYSGIQAFGWNPLVLDSERSIYESAIRNEGFENFVFTERSETNELVKAARREEYVVVKYIYPMEDNKAAFGFDIASDKKRLKAITKAFNTGELSVTDRIILVQETGNQFGVLLLQPIYHHDGPLDTAKARWKKRKGFVVEVLSIGNLVEAALKGFPDIEISVSLYDMSAEKGDRLLYYRPSRIPKTTDQPLTTEETQKGFSWSKTFDFSEHQWKIILKSSDFYYQSRKMWQPWIVLFGLLLFTILLAFYMLRKIQYTAEVEQREIKQAQTNLQLEDEIRERTAAEKKRNKTILKLQQALDEVKVLRGILPICASCKKIRDDKGYWKQIESYIKDHSEAEFSHGICPDCAKKLYPDFDNKQEDI